ncbi:MAG: AAA family ATPase [Eubacterium sp.]|nr:AAA family ATPase [Eubacterium sp.]
MKEIDGKTKVLGVIGNPIEHTLSPVIHNSLCRILGINAVYVPIHVENNIGSAVKGLCAAKVAGLNITVPYKQEVMENLVEIDPLAQRIGAVNTLVPHEGGYKGYNTDMPGLKRALESKGISLAGRKAIVIGAGGASRAVCIMLMDNGVDEIYLLNRSLDKAQAIAAEIPCVKALGLDEYDKIPFYNADEKNSRYIMFQCTSLGLKPGDKLAIEDDAFYRLADYGYDLIYNPANTPFINKLKSMNISCDNGLSMLLYQGLIAFEYWFDIKISQEVSQKVYDILRRKLYGDNIVLVGYMGSGKTSVGKELSEKYNMNFVDTDEYIVKTQAKSINKIFEESGEAGFRKIESDSIASLSGLCNTVISTGGGAVISSENREMLKKLGRVVYLKADTETIFNRVRHDDQRPLLKSESEEELKNRIENMLSVRRAYYETAAHKVVVTDNRAILDIVEEIAEELSE